MAKARRCGLDNQTIIIVSIVLVVGIALTVGQILFLTLTSCRNKNDIMFMIDDSKSVVDEDFQRTKDFIVRIANSDDITLAKKTANIAAGSFSKVAGFMDKFPNDHYMYEPDVIQQQMNSYQRMDCTDGENMFTPIDQRGCTNTVGALEFVSDTMIRDRSGYKTLIFMTDGGSNMGAERQDINLIGSSADAIKDQGTDIYTIRVGDSVEKYKDADNAEMEAIASGDTPKEKEQYMYRVQNFTALDVLVVDLSDKLCSKNYWLAAIPITVALIFIVIKLALDYCEHKKHERETEETAAMNRTEVM